MKTASWVIRNKLTKEVVLETYSESLAKAVNTKKYEAVPILQYLQELNRGIRAEVKCPCCDDGKSDLDGGCVCVEDCPNS